MNFGICQIIFTAWLAMDLGCYLVKHGEPRDGHYSFWTALIGAALEFVLLYFGGFYG